MAPTGDPMLWSAADAAAWLEENYPDAADKAREADVTGSVLCGMPEEELKEVLGLSLIARRKVGGKLKALHAKPRRRTLLERIKARLISHANLSHPNT